jgi:transcriptional regulator with XRE-family HTH domain
MKLQDYLDEASLTYTEFGARIEVGPETVRRYALGRRIPDRERMAKIALATGCKVTANDFFGIASSEATA